MTNIDIDLRVIEVSTEEKVTADHYARSALAGLAVDGSHVALVLCQPGVHVLAERPDQRKVGRVVIVKRKVLRKKKLRNLNKFLDYN